MLFRDTVPLILSFHWWDACFWMLGFILLTRKSDGHHETDSDKKSWLKTRWPHYGPYSTDQTGTIAEKQPTCQFVALRRTCNTANVVIVLYYHWINTGPGILRQRSVVWWQRKVYNATHNWWWHFFWVNLNRQVWLQRHERRTNSKDNAINETKENETIAWQIALLLPLPFILIICHPTFKEHQINGAPSSSIRSLHAIQRRSNILMDPTTSTQWANRKFEVV